MCPLDIQRSLKDTLKLKLKFGSDWCGWGVAAGGTSDDHDLKPTCTHWRLKGQNPPFSAHPGSNRLLELTGFKQKSSLRKAREELQEVGLILVKKGSGRTNSTYHFIFTPQESATVSPGGTHQHTPAGDQQAPQPAT